MGVYAVGTPWLIIGPSPEFSNPGPGRVGNTDVPGPATKLAPTLIGADPGTPDPETPAEEPTMPAVALLPVGLHVALVELFLVGLQVDPVQLHLAKHHVARYVPPLWTSPSIQGSNGEACF